MCGRTLDNGYPERIYTPKPVHIEFNWAGLARPQRSPCRPINHTDSRSGNHVVHHQTPVHHARRLPSSPAAKTLELLQGQREGERENERQWRSWTRASLSSGWSCGLYASPASSLPPSPASSAPGNHSPLVQGPIQLTFEQETQTDGLAIVSVAFDN